MNIGENKVITEALENLKVNTDIIGKWDANKIDEIDGKITFVINNEFIQFNTYVRETIRNFQLPDILRQDLEYGPIMVIARNIFPQIKKELRLRKSLTWKQMEIFI